MGRKYTNPQAHGYLMEAKGCEVVCKDLRRMAEKYKAAVAREAANRQAEFESVMEYTSERQIQDDYGWGVLSEKQYERYLDFFHQGQDALENTPPTPKVIAMRIVCRILADIEADQREWEFSALSPEEQARERERAEASNRAWKENIARIKRERGIVDAAPAPQEGETA